MSTSQSFTKVDVEPNDVLEVDIEVSRGHTYFKIDFYREVEGKRFSPRAHQRSMFLTRLPSHQADGFYAVRVPSTDISALVIHECWPRSQARISAAAAAIIEYHAAVWGAQQHALSRSLAYKDFVQHRARVTSLTAATPQFTPHVPTRSGSLMLHQSVALMNALSTDAYALFMEQGTGKTPVVIARLDHDVEHFKQDRFHRTLIVAPKNVRSNWLNEIAFFGRQNHRVVLVQGGLGSRISQICEAFATQEEGLKSVVVVASYDAVTTTIDFMTKIKWDLVVLDESHMIKSPNTQRTKACLQLRECSKTRMILTGTPICNSVMDLFPQLEFLREGGSGFSNFTAYKAFYGVYDSDNDGRGFKRLIGTQNMPYMQHRLARCAFVVRKEEALPDLPPKTYDVIDIEMSTEQWALYDKVAREITIEIEQELSNPKTMSVTNILVKLLRLAQITSGFVVYDAVYDENGEEIEGSVTDRIDPNPKIEALMEILKDKQPQQKTIVWACWRQDIKTIHARCQVDGIDSVVYYGGSSEVEKADAVRRFNNDPNCKMFIGNPGAGGTGLNLLGYPLHGSVEDTGTNCDHVIYFSQDWSYSKRAQSEDRAHRKGVRTSVRITDLCVPGTIDERIRERVLAKKSHALQVQDIRHILTQLNSKSRDS